MTCIIGIKHNDDIYIGGDSLGCDNNGFCFTSTEEKVFHRNEFLFGFCGNFRFGQILRYKFLIPERDESISDMEYLIGFFIPQLRINLDNERSIRSFNDGHATPGESELIFSYRKNIYKLYSDFSIEKNDDNILSVGCGHHIALGCMYALYELNPIERIRKSLQIVAKLNCSVREPFLILEDKK
jgi:ATP-dependent protease HslVU (ClpYQ) peptidase subunit